MGEVAVVAKVFPDSMEVFDELKENIKKKVNPYKLEEEEIAFGMKALRVTVIVKDAGGEDVEEKLKSLKGVSEVQIEEVGRI
ncbi:MAG: elongation factor 1-beta [Candidatus Micrarchaeia archaeon]